MKRKIQHGESGGISLSVRMGQIEVIRIWKSEKKYRQSYSVRVHFGNNT